MTRKKTDLEDLLLSVEQARQENYPDLPPRLFRRIVEIEYESFDDEQAALGAIRKEVREIVEAMNREDPNA